MAQTYKFGNGTWARKKGSTLAYNDEDNNFKPLPFNFTRDSIATRVNKEGLIEVVGNDIPRIDYTDSTEGALLLEPQRLQKIQYSEDFSDASWIKSGLLTPTSGFVSPKGDLSAFKLTEDSTLNNHRISVNGLIGSGTHTISVLAKANDRNWLLIRNAANNAWFDVSNGVIGNVQSGTGSIENYGNGWYRCSVTMSSLSTPAIGIADNNDSYSYQGDGTSGIYIFGVQVEAGSYPTSYIPNYGTSAGITRAAETCNESGNSEVFNDSQGVLFANMAALANDGTSRRVAISDGTYSNRIYFEYDETANRVYFVINSGGVNQVNIQYDANNLTLFNKLLVKYKANNFSVFFNGFKIGTDLSGSTPSGLKELAFDDGGNTSKFYGKTKEVGYYDTALTDEELEYMTSYRSLNEMVTELNLNAL